jgi:hypothetical protein
MASASEERRTLGFMCRNDYVTDRDAMIIGGKIAGPVTVMALQRTGVEATVSRRTPAANGDAEFSARRPTAWTPSMRLASTTLSVRGPAIGTHSSGNVCRGWNVD